MYNAAQHKGWSKQHKDKSRASPSRLTRLLSLTDMILTMWHDWRDIECQDWPIILQILTCRDGTNYPVLLANNHVFAILGFCLFHQFSNMNSNGDELAYKVVPLGYGVPYPRGTLHRNRGVRLGQNTVVRWRIFHAFLFVTSECLANGRR